MKNKFILLLIIGLAIFVFTSCSKDSHDNPEVEQTVEYIEEEFVKEDYSPYYVKDFTGYKLVTKSWDLVYVDYHTDINYIDSIQCIRYDEIKTKQKNLYKIRDNIENKNCE